MAKYILVDSNGVIVNRVEWDGETEWTPPEGLQMIHWPNACGPGWTWNGSKAIPPAEPEAPKPAQSSGKMEVL